MLMVVTLAGCASNREGDVAGAATAFYGALADHNGEAACALLAPATLEELEQISGKPCPEAIIEEQLPTPSDGGDVALFDTAGQVSYASETTFLSKFADGWRVVAAGCTPRRQEPYECALTGG